MMKKVISAISCTIILFYVTMFSSCDPVEPVVENEEELITTVTATFTPLAGPAVVLKFEDLDGDGGNDPVYTISPLMAETYYEIDVQFLNESVSPTVNMTEEVVAESESHQVFLILSGGVEWVFNYLDVDGGGLPLGIQNQVTTGEPGSGTLTLTLRHNLLKTALDVSSGDLTHAGGETDVEVVFDMIFQ